MRGTRDCSLKGRQVRVHSSSGRGATSPEHRERLERTVKHILSYALSGWLHEERRLGDDEAADKAGDLSFQQRHQKGDSTDIMRNHIDFGFGYASDLEQDR